MTRPSATVNYVIGSIFGNTVKMYVYGSGILTFWNFILGLLQTGSMSGAIRVAVEYFITKFTPFPLNEFFAAGGMVEFLFNIGLAVVVGACLAGLKYQINDPH
jgi:hypothetical protein